MRKYLRYIIPTIIIVLTVLTSILFAELRTIPHPSNYRASVPTATQNVSPDAVVDTRFLATLSKDVFPLEREANEVVWVPEQSAFYTHGGDKGRGSGSTESDSGIYKYVPGSNPVKVADLPTALHHIGFTYSLDTGKIYTYAGGVSFSGGGNQIYWFNPQDNTTGICAEVYPYNAVSVVAEYSTVQKKTYLFGGFNSDYVYHEIWKHDPVTGTVTKSKATLSGVFAFQATVYVEREDAVYLLGGIDKTGTSRTEIYRFDCTAEEITLLDAVSPDNKTKGMGAYYDSDLNVVVLAGGRDGNPWTGYTSRIWTFDLADYSVRVLSSALPGFVDDLGGGYDPINGKGYFMRVTPQGYKGYSRREPYSFGDSQKYICEIIHSE